MRPQSRHGNQFDREFARATRGVFAVAVIAVLVKIAVIAVILWAIVQLVQHFTS